MIVFASDVRSHNSRAKLQFNERITNLVILTR